MSLRSRGDIVLLDGDYQGAFIKSTVTLYPPAVTQGPPPRNWGKFWHFLRHWLAKPLVGYGVGQLAEWVRGFLFRTRQPFAPSR